MKRWALMAVLSVAAGCSNPDRDGGFYAYTDASGRLVTGEIPAKDTAADSTPADIEVAPVPATRPEPAPPVPEAVDTDVLAAELWQPAAGAQSTPDAAAWSAAETDDPSDRFVTYYDASGQLQRERIDVPAAQAARRERAAAYVAIEAPDSEEFLETVTPIRADCCQHLREGATLLRPGKEHSLRFAPGQGPFLRQGDRLLPARVVALAPEVKDVELVSFKRGGQYVHPQLLVLDGEGTPVLQVNNLFTRRYPESWAHYASVQGTLPREPSHRYLIFYLDYSAAAQALWVPEQDAALSEQGALLVRTR